MRLFSNYHPSHQALWNRSPLVWQRWDRSAIQLLRVLSLRYRHDWGRYCNTQVRGEGQKAAAVCQFEFSIADVLKRAASQAWLEQTTLSATTRMPSGTLAAGWTPAVQKSHLTRPSHFVQTSRNPISNTLSVHSHHLMSMAASPLRTASCMARACPAFDCRGNQLGDLLKRS